MDMSKFSDRVRQMLKDNHRWNVQRGWVAAGALVLVVAVCAMLTGRATALVGQDALKNALTDNSKLYWESPNAGETGWTAVDENTPVAGDSALRLRLAFKLSSNQLDDTKALSYKLPESLTLPDSADGKTIAVYDGANAATADETGDTQIGSATIKNNVLTLTLDATGSESAKSGTAGTSTEKSSDAAGSASKAAEISGFVDLDFTFDELKLDDDGTAALRLSSSRVLHVTEAAAETKAVTANATSDEEGASSAASENDETEAAISASTEAAAKAAPAAMLASSDSTASDTSSSNSSSSSSTHAGTDFTQYLTSNAGVQKLVDGKWTNVTEVTEGDTVRVNLAYTLPANTLNSTTETGRTIYCQLPTGITPNEAASGRVTNTKGEEVGSYTITTDGLATIVFDQSAVESESGAIEGTLSFSGTVSKLSSDDSGTYNLGGASTTITIKKKTTTETTDLKVEKSAPTVSDDKTTASYTVNLSSEKGTGGENVYFSDTLTGTNATPDFDADSITVVKVDASGNRSTVTGFEKKWQKGSASNKYRFDTTLPALAASEHYEITYNVNINADATASSVNVSNTADGRTDHTNRVWDTKSFGWGTSVAKSGWYNKENNTIHWDIRVDPHGGSIVGQKVSDVLPDGLKLAGSYYVKGDDGTMLINANGCNGAAGDSSINFTFPSTMDTGTVLTNPQKQQAYTISFDTTAPADNKTVTNSATGTDTSGKTSTGQTGVYVEHRTYDVSKAYVSDEASPSKDKDRRLSWTSTITLPDTNLANFEYTDTIENATDGNGTDLGADSHYAAAGELEKYLATDQHLVINLSDGSQYVYRGYTATKDHVIKNGAEAATDDVDIKVTYYDANGNEVTPSDANYSTHIKSFKVSVTVASGVEVVAKNMVLSGYQTYLNSSAGTSGDTWTAKNKGEINGKTSEAAHAYPIPKMFDKSVRVKDGNAPDAFSSGSASITLDSLKNQLEYRLLLFTDASTGSTIQVTDTPPAGMEIVDGSVYARFYVNSYDEHQTNYDDGTTFVDGANSTTGANPTYTATKNSDGTTTVVFTISNYKYRSGYPQIALHYKTTVGSDSYWNNLSNLNKTYENTASWNGNTDSNKTNVTREIKNVEKSGEQLEDSSGNPQNVMRYYVDINPAAKDLDGSSDVLTLTDTFSDMSKYSPELLMETVHLYAYDASAEHHKGAEIDSSRYTLTYDSSTATITVKIPDKLACVLQYDYRIDENTLASSNSVTNTAKLSGNWSTSNSTQLKEVKSHATATHRSIKLYKVDADNYRKLLPDAVFKLERWDSSSSAWTTVNSSEETGSDGILTWDLIGTTSNPAEISVNTLYRLTETKAPEGYALDGTPHYFICRDDGASNDTAWAAAGGSSATGTQSGTTVQQSDTTFFNYSGGAFYVPNKYTRLTVTKKWANADGTNMDAPSGASVKVQLYQSKQEADPDDTCAVTITYKGNESNPGWKPGGTITQNVKRGTSLKFTVSNWHIKYDVTIGGEKSSYENSTVESRQISVSSSATQGSTLDILVQETDAANAPAVTLDEYTAPNTILTGGTAYGDPVTLQDGAWSHSWDNLPTTDADGNQLRYTVKEEGVSGYVASYTNNEGTQTGNITVTNTEQGYELPETGGAGSSGIVAAGAAIAAGAAAALAWRKRRRA